MANFSSFSTGYSDIYPNSKYEMSKTFSSIFFLHFVKILKLGFDQIGYDWIFT